MSGEKRYTPFEFLNHSVRKADSYTKDSLPITSQFRQSLKRREDFFHNKAYFELTLLMIDSIVYSPNFKKMAVFLIVKNPTYRQLAPEKNYEWYYDATCYLGIRQNDSIDLIRIGPDFTNSIDRKGLSFLIRNTYFTEYATYKDASGKLQYKYNIDDVRFWNCPIWDEIEERKKRRREFEKEKIEHPENVYEPKD